MGWGGWTPNRRGLLRTAAALGGLAAAGSAGAGRPRPAGTAGGDVAGIAADEYLSDLAVRRLFRGAALVARGGRVLLGKGYDWADIAHRAPNTQHTRFRIASVTKQFTALAVLQLQDRGRLDVRDRLSAYLRSTPPAWRPITLHQLLTHTSGIPDYFGLPGFTAIEKQAVTPEQLIALFRDLPLDFPPGTRWSYSDSGYVLLGHIVSRLTGLSYAGFLQRHVFAPLGLSGTGYDVDHPSPPRHAAGYTDWHTVAPFIDISVLYAAGALYSTVGDLLRWDRALAAGSPALLSARGLREAFTPYVSTGLPVARSAAYGYGWFIGTEGGRRLYSHVGDINGFVSFNGFFPDDGLTVVVLSNLESAPDPGDVAAHLAGITFGYADCREPAGACPEMA